MSNKNTTDHSTTGSATEDYKDQGSKYNLNKFEYDLFHEEDNIPEKVIRVKRFSMPNKGEKWKIMSNNTVIFVVESSKVSKKEREFLQTADGFNFLLQQAKAGIKSLNSLKIEIKKVIENTVPEAIETKEEKIKPSKKIKSKK